MSQIAKNDDRTKNVSNNATTSTTTTTTTTSSSSDNTNIDNILIKHHYRLCHIIKRSDFDGYGFNLHSEKGKSGQYIGKVDDNSPAELAGLKEGDRIIQVNNIDIGNETHKQVVQRIKSISSEVRLLVIDPIKEKDILKQEKTILSAIAITTTTTEPSLPIESKSIIIASNKQSPILSEIKNNNNNNINNINNNKNDDNIDGGINDIIKTTSTITVQSTKTITTNKDNISISSSQASSSIPSSPLITNIKKTNNNINNDNNDVIVDDDENDIVTNDNDNNNAKLQQKTQYDLSNNDNKKLSLSSTSPTGIQKNYQTNIEFIINENKTIEQINNNNNNHSNNINHQNGKDNIDNHNNNNNNNINNNIKNNNSIIITDDNHENSIKNNNNNNHHHHHQHHHDTINIDSLNKIDDNINNDKLNNEHHHDHDHHHHHHHQDQNHSIQTSIKDTGNDLITINTSSTSTSSTVNINDNNNKKSSLNLPMTAAEMRAKLLSKKKYDPKNDSVDLRKKFEIIQKL